MLAAGSEAAVGVVDVAAGDVVEFVPFALSAAVSVASVVRGAGTEEEGVGGAGVHKGEKAPVADPGFTKNLESYSKASKL